MSWQAAMGPWTRTMGSRGKTTWPSGTAHTSTSMAKARSHSRKAGLNIAPPPGAESDPR